jgi:hypothetical protein
MILLLLIEKWGEGLNNITGSAAGILCAHVWPDLHSDACRICADLGNLPCAGDRRRYLDPYSGCP